MGNSDSTESKPPMTSEVVITRTKRFVKKRKKNRAPEEVTQETALSMPVTLLGTMSEKKSVRAAYKFIEQIDRELSEEEKEQEEEEKEKERGAKRKRIEPLTS